MPRLPDPNFNRWGHGVSLLGGWFPLTVEIVTVVVLIAAIGWRTRRWRLVWVPVSAAVGLVSALAAPSPSPCWDSGPRSGGDVACRCWQFRSRWFARSWCSTNGWATTRPWNERGPI
jgi:hypothetical protein